MSVIQAEYFDGKTSAKRPVSLVIDPNSGFVGSQVLMNLSHAYQKALSADGGSVPDSFFSQQKLLSFDDQHRILGSEGEGLQGVGGAGP